MSHQRKSRIVTEKDSWETPGWLFDLLDQEFHFDCDAAATLENSKCDIMFTKGESDALSHHDWWGYVPGEDADTEVKRFFLNPPYSAGNIDRFMQKAYEESQKGALVVCLVPCATDTRWWHSYAMKAQEIRFIKGRVRLVGYDEDGEQVRNSPTFSSCVVIFNRNVPEGYSRLLWDRPYIGPTIEQPRSRSTAGEQQQQKEEQ